MRRRVAFVLGLAALSSAGCGQGLQTHGGLAATEQLVTPAEVASQPTASPQRALLTWWRNVQYSDEIGYLDFLDPPIAQRELQANNAELYLALLSSQLQPAKPQITGVQRTGSAATVFSNIVVHQPIGNQLYVTTSRPQAFALRRVQGRWRLLDDYFVRLIIGPQLASRASSRP